MNQDEDEITFWEEIKDRVKDPPWKAVFIAYLALSFILGALGVYASVYDVCRDNNGQYYRIAQSIGTFFIAVIVASCADLYVGQQRNDKAFRLWSLLGFCASFALLWCIYQIQSNYAFIPAFLGFVFAVIFWIIANSKDQRFAENYSIGVSKDVKEHMDQLEP